MKIITPSALIALFANPAFAHTTVQAHAHGAESVHFLVVVGLAIGAAATAWWAASR